MGSTPTTDRDRVGTGWSALRARARAWDPPAVPTLVVCPHPDDESLSSGGLIARQRRRGVDVLVVAVTDGEAAYPGMVDPASLACRRRLEQGRALAALGVPGDGLLRLGIPDGAVARHEHVLAAALVPLVRGRGLVVAPWIGDVHPDHEACGRAALASLGPAGGAALVHSLFWAWHHPPRDRIPASRLLAVGLDGDERACRDRAVSCYGSQFTDELAPPVLEARHLVPSRWWAEHYVAGPGTVG